MLKKKYLYAELELSYEDNAICIDWSSTHDHHIALSYDGELRTEDQLLYSTVCIPLDETSDHKAEFTLISYRWNTDEFEAGSDEDLNMDDYSLPLESEVERDVWGIPKYDEYGTPLYLGVPILSDDYEDKISVDITLLAKQREVNCRFRVYRLSMNDLEDSKYIEIDPDYGELLTQYYGDKMEEDFLESIEIGKQNPLNLSELELLNKFKISISVMAADKKEIFYKDDSTKGIWLKVAEIALPIELEFPKNSRIDRSKEYFNFDAFGFLSENDDEENE